MATTGDHMCQVTNFTSNQYEFSWKLKNCPLIFATSASKTFVSNEFTLDKTNQKCYLTLNIDDLQENDETTGSTLTVTVGKGSQKTKLLIEVLILDRINDKNYVAPANTIIVNRCSVNSCFELPAQNYTKTMFPRSLKYYLDSGSLTFVCKIQDIREYCTKEKKISILDNKMQITMEMFKSFYLNNELFDVTIFTDTENIKAHVLVLSAASSYFRKVFINDEGGPHYIIDFSTDTDITSEIFRGFLNYIYGIKSVDEMKHIATELLILALKFNMNNLKNSCEYIIGDVVNKNNVVTTLLFAHKYDLKLLKEKALTVAKIHMKDIKNSEFEKISKDINLFNQLLTHVPITDMEISTT